MHRGTSIIVLVYSLPGLAKGISESLYIHIGFNVITFAFSRVRGVLFPASVLFVPALPLDIL